MPAVMYIVYVAVHLLTTLMLTLTTSVHISTEPTISLRTITSVMSGVQDMDRVAYWLQIPPSKQTEIQQQYDSVPLRKQAYMEYWLAHHPAPSWKVIAISLWVTGELAALEMVQKLYFKGKSHEHMLARAVTMCLA